MTALFFVVSLESEDTVNDDDVDSGDSVGSIDSVDSIVQNTFVKATRKPRLAGLPQDCNPANAASLFDSAYNIYSECGCLYDTHPFFILSVKYVIPLLNGIRELIVSPHLEAEMMDLLDRGFTYGQVESAKKNFVIFAGANGINSAVLVNDILGSLDDWITEDFSPDKKHLELLGKFLHCLAKDNGRNIEYC
jgi:hypothetical protein